MRFRLPMLFAGWRSFSGEVSIVVLGVLLALAAQQIVEEISERNVAENTRAAVRDELKTGLASLVLRQQAQPCITRRLDEIRQLVDEWGRTGDFETPRWVGSAPAFGVSLVRYDAANAAGRLAPLPSDEQYRLGITAVGLDLYRDLQQQEQYQWARLRMLQAGAEALSVEDRATIRIALQEAQLLDYRAKLAARQTIPLAATAGMKPDFTAFRQRAALSWKGGKVVPSICYGLDTPPEVANRHNVVPVPQ